MGTYKVQIQYNLKQKKFYPFLKFIIQMKAIIFVAVLLVAANCFSFKNIGNDIKNAAHHIGSEINEYKGCFNTINQNKDAFTQLQNLKNAPQDIAEDWDPVAQGLYNILVSCFGNADQWAFLTKIQLNNGAEVTDCVNDIITLSQAAQNIGNIANDIKNIKTLSNDVKSLATTCKNAEQDNINN